MATVFVMGGGDIGGFWGAWVGGVWAGTVATGDVGVGVLGVGAVVGWLTLNVRAAPLPELNCGL